MGKRIFLCVVLLCSIGLGFIVYGNTNTEYKSEIDKKNLKESRTEDDFIENDDVSYKQNGLVLIPSKVNYDSIENFYTASNSHLISTYNIDKTQIKLELVFKADGYFFLYHGLNNSIAYEGEYKLIDKTIYAKVNRIYESNKCYKYANGLYEFDILKKNGRKVIDLTINGLEFKEINKKLLTINDIYKYKDNIKLCN